MHETDSIIATFLYDHGYREHGEAFQAPDGRWVQPLVSGRHKLVAPFAEVDEDGNLVDEHDEDHEVVATAVLMFRLDHDHADRLVEMGLYTLQWAGHES